MQNNIVFLLCDTIVHWGPFIVLYNCNDFVFMNINYMNSYIGIITGFCHSTYSYFTIKTINPSILYHLPENKYSKNQINLGWILLYLFHIIGSIIIN